MVSCPLILLLIILYGNIFRLFGLSTTDSCHSASKLNDKIMISTLHNPWLLENLTYQSGIQSIDDSNLRCLNLVFKSQSYLAGRHSNSSKIPTSNDTSAATTKNMICNDISGCGPDTMNNNISSQSLSMQSDIEYAFLLGNPEALGIDRSIKRWYHSFVGTQTDPERVHFNASSILSLCVIFIDESISRTLRRKRKYQRFFWPPHSIHFKTQTIGRRLRLKRHDPRSAIDIPKFWQQNVCDNCELQVNIQLDSLNASGCGYVITQLRVHSADNTSDRGPALPASVDIVQTDLFQNITRVSDNTIILESFLLCSCKGSFVRIPTLITMQNLSRCNQARQEVFSGQCSPHLEIFLIVSVTAVVLSVLCAVLIYKCRWRIKYVYHLVRNKDRRHDIEEEDDFEYDAFIAYADDDREFVIKDIRLKLEEEFGLRLCIHHRDFIPGQPIADNIAEAIEKSKKVIVVLSPHFFQSYWCTYEVQMAKYAGIRRGRNMIIVVVYRQVKVRDVTKEVRDLMKIDSFATFPNDPLGQKVFWGNMRIAIRK